MVPDVDLRSYPLVIHGPFGVPEQGFHERAVAMERRVCEAVGAALGLSGGVHPVSCLLDRRAAFDAAYLNITSQDEGGADTCHVRILGMVRRSGEPMLGVSVVATEGGRVVRWSGDVDGKTSECGLLLFADASGEPIAIDDALRERIAGVLPAKAPKKPRVATRAARSAPVLVAESLLRDVVLSPDGRSIATTHESQRLTLWDAATGTKRWDRRVGGNGMLFVRAAAFSPDSQSVVSGATSLWVFSVEDGQPLRAPVGHPRGEVLRLRWTSAGLLSVSGLPVEGRDNAIATWGPDMAPVTRWRWALPAWADTAGGEPGVVFASGGRSGRAERVLCRLDAGTGEVLAERTLEGCGPWFAAHAAGLWLNGTSSFVRLHPVTLEPRQRIPVEGDEVLRAVTVDALWSTRGLTVCRRDLDGHLIHSWTVPPLDLGGHVAATRAAGKDPGLVTDESLETLGHLAVAEDRVVAATSLSISIWTTGGEVVLLPRLPMEGGRS